APAGTHGPDKEAIARRTKSMGVRGAWIVRCVLCAILSSVVLAAQGQAAVPNPAVQGPIEGGVHGYPWNHSLFPPSGHGYSYTENEYFFSGTATNLEKGVSAPYTSRMLVRLPIDPVEFNG